MVKKNYLEKSKELECIETNLISEKTGKNTIKLCRDASYIFAVATTSAGILSDNIFITVPLVTLGLGYSISTGFFGTFYSQSKKNVKTLTKKYNEHVKEN